MFVAPKGLVSGIRTFSIRENNHEVSLNVPIILFGNDYFFLLR